MGSKKEDLVNIYRDIYGMVKSTLADSNCPLSVSWGGHVISIFNQMVE